MPKNPTTGSATVNFDLGDEPTFEMPDIPKRRSPEPVVAAPPTQSVEYDVTDTVQRRYHTKTETVATYDEEVEEPEDDYEPPVLEYGTIEETEEILEIVEYDSDGNEIIVESRTLRSRRGSRRRRPRRDGRAGSRGGGRRRRPASNNQSLASRDCGVVWAPRPTI